MLVLSAAALLVALVGRGLQRAAALALALMPWVGGAMLQAIDWTAASGPAIRSTLVQGGIPQDRKWLPEQRGPTMSFYRMATERAATSEIVVWPEVAVPSVTDRVEDYIDSLAGLSERTGQSILFGILEREIERGGEGRIYNSVIHVAGDTREVYRKRHLVPFGEYFPVPPQVREWMRLMNLPFSDISPGRADQPLLVTAGGTALAVAICYEDAYAAELLYGLPEAEILINVSNDAWFGDSIAPHQHLQIARMRSLETGRYTIRATNTGISAFIDERGRVLESGPQFQPVELTMAVEPRRGSTPFVAAGNLPVVVLGLLLTAGFWLRNRAF
jgi:apolipoprotein N-acyltransferase